MDLESACCVGLARWSAWMKERRVNKKTGEVTHQTLRTGKLRRNSYLPHLVTQTSPAQLFGHDRRCSAFTVQPRFLTASSIHRKIKTMHP